MKLLSVLFFAILSTAVVGQDVLTPELLWKLNRLSGGTISPDGNYLLYSQRKYNVAENKGNSDLFVMNLKTNEVKQLTKTPFSEFEAQWTADNTIWFMSTENEGVQIWKMKLDGTDKTQISHFEDVELEGFRISSDAERIVTLQAVKIKPTVNELYEDLPQANARIEDDLMYRHWDHWDDYKVRHIFAYTFKDTPIGKALHHIGTDLLQGEPYNAILPPFGGLESMTFTADNQGLIYTSKKQQGKEFAQSTNSDLYMYSFETQTTRQLKWNQQGYDQQPSFSANGDMAWLSMKKDGFESDKNDILIHSKDGSTRNLTENMDVSVADYTWSSDGSKLFFIAPIKGTKQIFEITYPAGTIRQLTQGQHDYVSLSTHGDKIVAGKQSMVHPVDYYELTITKGRKSKISPVVERRLTTVNDRILDQLKKPIVQERWVTTSDNKKMLVWMILPPDFDSTKTYPTLLYCQGGPQSPVSQFFSYRWNFMLMASQGYIVVAPNRRGLPGFGQEWNDAISKDWGGQPMRDYLAAIDDAAKLPYVDENRLGAIGASYGGYSVYYLAGIHENRFKTFISHCGLFNLESWYGTTEELFFANWDIGGPYWDPKNKDLYAKNSPHNYVANWNTPILVIHGGMDFRVPISEGMQAYQAAQLKGIKSKFLYFPEEGHWVLSPQNGLLWHREFFKWLAEDLK